MRPQTATIWYCGALIADGPRRISLKESCDEPNAATCRGPWLGSSTNNVRPDALCSIPIMVRECPRKKILQLNYYLLMKWFKCAPWCWRYKGGVYTRGSSKYWNTQLNSSGWRPSDDVGRWKSTSWQLILSHERTVTTSVAPIHFLVLYSLQPSCSEPYEPRSEFN